jgi:hypothetical protein
VRWHRAAPDLKDAVGSRGRGVRGSASAWGQEKKGEGARARRWMVRVTSNGPQPVGAGGAIDVQTGEPGADRWATVTVSGGGTG